MDNWCLVVDGEPTHAESLRAFCELGWTPTGHLS